MHQHREKTHRTVGWTSCVAGGTDCGGAHGAVVHVATCSCGAVRKTESNGRHVARGEWEMPKTAYSTLNISRVLHSRLRIAAATAGRPIMEVVEEALDEWLERRNED